MGDIKDNDPNLARSAETGRHRKLYSSKGLTPIQLETREHVQRSLRAFVALVAPQRLIGHCQEEMLNEFADYEVSHVLALLPRGHQKSIMIAYYVAWHIINNPETTIIYASATSGLAEAQLSIIKQILDNPILRKYFPELLEEDTGRRSMWRNDSIAVDHPVRYTEAVRDPTVKAVGMGANIVGFHADLIVLDDVVVQDNAETKTERDKVRTWYSLLTSVLNPGGVIRAVGTRYHPEDLWNDLMEMTEEIYDDEGEIIAEEKVYRFIERVVEVDGEFLWPRTKRRDGKWFGFNKKELSRIRAQYLDKAKFRAQYYNDPNDPDNQRISNFIYYDRSKAVRTHRGWMLGEKLLNVFAAIDFAATVSKKADYTAITVIGIDEDHCIYVLDIDRFKTDKISEMHTHLTNLYNKWGWVKLRAEATAAQNLVVEHIKERNRDQNIYYTIDSVKPTSEKMIRIMSILEPRYAESKIFHYKGGHCQILEDELVATKPPHDDVSDSLASAVEIAIAPTKRRGAGDNGNLVNLTTHPKFGGIM